MTLRGFALGTSDEGVLIVDRHGDAVNLAWADAVVLARTILDSHEFRLPPAQRCWDEELT